MLRSLALTLLLCTPLLASAQRMPRDPFAPLVEIQVEDPTVLPQQRFEVTAYRFMGMLRDGERSWALVEDAEGGSFVLKEGDYLGHNWGIVRRIDDGRLVVQEEMMTPLGERVVEQKELLLTSPGGRR